MYTVAEGFACICANVLCVQCCVCSVVCAVLCVQCCVDCCRVMCSVEVPNMLCVSSGVFTVELRGPGRIAIHSVKEHEKYMRIKDGKLDHGGDGGEWCDFYVHDVGK